jgi:hypothetical protein
MQISRGTVSGIRRVNASPTSLSITVLMVTIYLSFRYGFKQNRLFLKDTFSAAALRVSLRGTAALRAEGLFSGLSPRTPPLHVLCAPDARPPARFYTHHCDQPCLLKKLCVSASLR